MRQLLSKIKQAIIGINQNSTEKVPAISSQVKKEVIGQSIEKRDILAYKIGTGQKKILFLAGTHGNEVGTVKLTHHLINFLDQKYGKQEALSLHVIPLLNPDGYANALQNPDYFNFGRIGRFNANNVDLNRNFKTKSWQSETDWAHGKNYQECTRVFAGEKPFSEPETRALRDFIAKQGIEVLISFHNAGADVMGNNNELSQKLARLFCKISGYKYTSEEEWVALRQTGTTKEWCDEQGISYVEIEGSTRWGSDWYKQKQAIQTMIDYIEKDKL